jgi:hypothetical protein
MWRFIMLAFFVGITTLSSFAQTPFQRTLTLRYRYVSQEALEKVNWDWRPILPEWKIRFHPGRPNLLGLCDSRRRTIDIWIRSSQSTEAVAATLVHELAHGFDVEFLTDEMRREWLAIRRLPPDTPWYPSTLSRNCPDYLFGAGDFAESVSWTLQGPGVKFRSRLGPPPNDEQRSLIWKWLNMIQVAAK